MMTPAAGTGWIAGLKRSWALIAGLIAVGVWVGTLQSDMNHKANSDTVAALTYQIQNQLTAIQNQLSDIQSRQRQMACIGKPDWCR